jgi:hypothetical protein
LKTKTNKSTYDDNQFEASASKFSKVSVQNLEELHLNYFESEFEKYYLIDMAGMALLMVRLKMKNLIFLYKLAEMKTPMHL